MDILELLLFLLVLSLAFGFLPAIALCALWDLIAFIVFLATLKKDEVKHKKAEKAFITSSVFLTISAALAAVCYLLVVLVTKIMY